MSVIVETSLGDFTIDLYTDERPKCCKNFLKLCKVKYYNYCLFHSVQRNFIAQTGDPSGTGKEGESIYGVLYGEQARYFDWEFVPKIKHMKTGQVSMVNNGNNMHGSQFFIALGNSLEYLDGVHTVFGEVTEGLDVIEKLNEAYSDEKFRPYRDIRIHHTIILDDPYEDPRGLDVPDRSPSPTQEVIERARLAADAEIDDLEGKTEEEIKEIMEGREEKANAQVLEMIGDLPSTDITAPENVLFVCKLNSVTTDEDLEIIFSRFGPIRSCEVIRDHKTGESLQYAFIEFEKKKDCESAYFKMDNVLIDDRRIHVDFSQSVSKIKWKGKGKGVETFKEEPKKPQYIIKDQSRRQDNKYELVFEENGDGKSSKKKQKNRSPEHDDSRHKKKQSFRSRSRSPNRQNYRAPWRDRREDSRRNERRYSPPQRNRDNRELPSRRRFSPPRRRSPDRGNNKLIERDWRHERQRDESPRRYKERDDSPPRTKREGMDRGHRSSPPSNRYRSPPRIARERRYSSSDSDDNRKDKKKTRKNKYDSSDDEDDRRKSRHIGKAAESSDDERNVKQKMKKRLKSDSSDDRMRGRKMQSYGSSSEEESLDRNRGKMRHKRDLSNESTERKKSKKKKKHVDYSSDEDLIKKKKKRNKNDFSDEIEKSKKKKKKKKHEKSESEEDRRKKKRRESSSEEEESGRNKHSKSSKNRYRDSSGSPVRTDKYSSDSRKKNSRKERNEYVDRRR